MSNYKVAVVGLGYVGLPVALHISKKGHQVIGFDLDKEKLIKIKNRTSPIKDRSVSQELKVTNLKVTNQFNSIANVEIIIICVPTPINKDKTPNNKYIITASKDIAKFLKKGQLIVIESTVHPGTIEEIIIPILENVSKLKAGKDFYVAHVPERINPGDEVWHIENIPRVAGGLNIISLKKTIAFYKTIIDTEIYSLDTLREAEAVKLVENSFRDINIAFINELAMSFSRVGINIHNVIKGAATKPFSFLPHYPGCGVGGDCIPVSPYFLINYGRKNGFTHNLLLAARKVNREMPKFTVSLLLNALNEAKLVKKNVKVCILGLTYKPDIDDVRDSPSLNLLKILEDEGIATCVYDPYVTTGKLDDILHDIQAVILATAHKQFKLIKPEYFKSKGVQIVIDGRNCFDLNLYRESGLIYKGIGS